MVKKGLFLLICHGVTGAGPMGPESPNSKGQAPEKFQGQTPINRERCLISKEGQEQVRHDSQAFGGLFWTGFIKSDQSV
jgi:hypothetical protein